MREAVFDDDVHHLEGQIRRLETEYNRYFTGSSPRPPSHLQGELAARVRRRMETGEKLTAAQKFRLEGIISRFHILSEMWTRNVRNIEDGRPAVLNRRSSDLPQGQDRPSIETEVLKVHLSLAGSQPETEEMKKLYRTYLSASAPSGGPSRTVSYQKFYRQIHTRLEKLQRDHGSDGAVCRIVLVDNRPILKVKSGS